MNRPAAFYDDAGPRHAGAVCPLCEVEIRSGELLAICNACGAVHHRSCWQRTGCGSYACSSGRANLAGRAALVVTADELANAVP
ncbi:MAG TPA: RING finger protein, partial [Pirellulales bacterium]|nr:RING finger protein [Pirellulales bacterium]